MSRVGELSVDITADASRLRRELSSITGAGGPLAALPRVAAVAALAAGAAIAGFGTRSVTVFAEFDTKMREVFTLLPGITAEAMDGMEAEVLAFSREFGKLPNEVIPALYQAISAGVPSDNVFEFMEVAAQTAVGGVSDLTTAVDALTSVINAYGRENITANEASDSLFTAVRLGKTTIDELAAGMSNVAPVAADLGIEFDAVTAALAAMTSQGVPTQQATTQLRQLLIELGKEGTNAANVFHGITGQTFPEFIAGGGTLEQALQSLANYASENGLRMTDVFSSVEAGMAATVLGGEQGSAAYGVALDAMGEKAGATQAAFETMDGGIQASWNRLTAGFNTLVVEVGDELAPMFQEAVNVIVRDVMPVLRDTVIGIFQGIAATTTWLKEQWARFATDTDGIYADVRTTVEVVGAAIVAIFGVLAALWDTVLKPAWDAIAPAVSVVFGVVTTVIHAALEAITGIMRALAAFLRGDWEGAWQGMGDAVTAIVTGLRDVLYGIFNGLKEWMGQNARDIATNAGINWAGVVSAIEGAFSGIAAFVQGIFDSIVATITNAIASARAAAESVMDFVRGIGGSIENARNAARDAATAVADFVTGTPQNPDAARELGATIQLPHEGGGLPRFAVGGIVTGPMRAIVGEAGPEAIIPLDRLENLVGAGNQTIIVELDGHQLMRAIAPRMVNDLRLRTGITGA